MAKGVNEELSRSLLELEPTARLEFFIIYYDIDNDNSFIPITPNKNGLNDYIYWQGVKYIPFNIESTQWEIKSDQTLPRPKITLSNKNLLVSTLLNKYKNLNNCRVIRKVTYARFLDNQNFPNNQNPYGEENFYAGLPDQKYYISRVISQNNEKVELELVSPLEIENQKVPNRKIHSQRCPWVYRGLGCQYVGPPVAEQDDTLIGEGLTITNKGLYDSNKTYNSGDVVYIEGKKYKMNSYGGQGFKGIRFYYLCVGTSVTSDPRNDSTNWKKDSCGKSVQSCQIRFGENSPNLPFGGFPGTHRYPFSNRG